MERNNPQEAGQKRTYNKWDGANKHHYRRAYEQNDHLNLCSGQTPKAASSPPRVHVAPKVGSQRRPAHEAPVHPDQSPAHQHVTDNSDEDKKRAEARIHVGVGGIAGLVAPPL